MINPTQKLVIKESTEIVRKKITEFCKYLKDQGYQYEIKKIETKIIDLYTSCNVGI